MDRTLEERTISVEAGGKEVDMTFKLKEYENGKYAIIDIGGGKFRVTIPKVKKESYDEMARCLERGDYEFICSNGKIYGLNIFNKKR